MARCWRAARLTVDRRGCRSGRSCRSGRFGRRRRRRQRRRRLRGQVDLPIHRRSRAARLLPALPERRRDLERTDRAHVGVLRDVSAGRRAQRRRAGERRVGGHEHGSHLRPDEPRWRRNVRVRRYRRLRRQPRGRRVCLVRADLPRRSGDRHRLGRDDVHRVHIGAGSDLAAPIDQPRRDLGAPRGFSTTAAISPEIELLAIGARALVELPHVRRDRTLRVPDHAGPRRDVVRRARRHTRSRPASSAWMPSSRCGAEPLP